MNRKILFAWYICLTLVGIVSCKKEKTEFFTIDYKRGSAWVDYSYSVTINQDGIMNVKSHNGLADDYRESNYLVSAENLAVLRNSLNKLTLVELKDKYGFGPDKPSDLPVSMYGYQTNIKSDATTIYFPEKNELPNQLTSFISTLNQVITDTDTLRNR
jgi:hypothetical protein